MNTIPVKPGETATIDPKEDGQALMDNSTEQKMLQTLIKRRHPLYEETKPHWEFLESTYNGGREWFKDNVHRYLKEGDIEYNNRLERAYRFNHTREVVDLLNKYLFKQNIKRSEDAPASVQKFWKQSTRNGLAIKDYARQISKKTSIFGRIAIVVDNNAPANISELSKAEADDLGVKTYSYIVPPDQILDHSFDDNGELNWILLKEIRRDDADPMTSSGKEEIYYRLWTRNEWILMTVKTTGRIKKVVIEDQAIHGLGIVPVVLADNIVSDDLYVTPSLIDDIAYLDKAVGNYLSNLDAIIQDQTFSQLAMPAQNLMPGDDDYNKLVDVGTKRIFVYDGESGSQPFYLSPDVKQAGILLEVINKIINEIYHTVGLAGERTKQDNSQGIDNSSGVAKAYDFERVNALLAAKADSLEIIENKIVRIVALWNGEEDEVEEGADLISYPDNFDTRGLYDEFDLAARLMLIDAPDAVRQEQMRILLDKLFPQLKAELRSTMEAQLKDWPVDPLELASDVQALQKTADKNTAVETVKAV